MSEHGALRETYAAALQHDLIELEGDEHLVSVARRPLSWLQGQVDEILSALGPPPDLLDEFKARQDALRNQGLSDEEAHNTALEDIDYEAKYCSYITESATAQEARTYLTDRLQQGADVILVCYENTDEKRCHRTRLKEILAERRSTEQFG